MNGCSGIDNSGFGTIGLDTSAVRGNRRLGA
jgi:hypothetical protein